jgi:hypothetical protein
MNDTTVNIENHEEELKDMKALGFFDSCQVYVPDRLSSHDPESLLECMEQHGITDVEDQYGFLSLWQRFIYTNQYSISYETSCKCWRAIRDGIMHVDNGSPSYENNICYTARYLLDDMCYHNIAHAQEIYQYYIADHYDNPRMFGLRSSVFLEGMGSSDGRRSRYYPYRSSCVHMSYCYRIEDDEDSRTYTPYVEMYRSFGKEGADVMAELGYDAIDDIMHIMSSSGMRKYSLTRRKVVSIAYELHDDRKALDWFMSLLNLMKGQDRITIKHLDADFVRKNKDVPLGFITECILIDHVDYDEYKDRLDALLNHIIDVTYPESLSKVVRIGDSNRDKMYSDWEYDLETNVSYKIKYSILVSSIARLFGFGSERERYQEIPNTTVGRAYNLMEKLMDIPDSVWNTFYGAHGYRYSKSNGGNVFVYPSFMVFKSGFEYVKSNRISPDVNHAYHIVSAGDDVVYRWAVWTNTYLVLNANSWSFTSTTSSGKRFAWLNDYVMNGKDIAFDDMNKDVDEYQDTDASVISGIIDVMHGLPKTIKEMEAALKTSSMENPNDYVMNAYGEYTTSIKRAL